MATLVKLPKCGINMEEGTILKFYVKEGDAVQADQPLAELETDKNVTEITAPEDGVILKILCAANETLPILTPVFALGAAGESYEGETAESAAPAAADPMTGAVSGGMASAASANAVPAAGEAWTGSAGNDASGAAVPAAGGDGNRMTAAPVASAGNDGGNANPPQGRIKATPLARRMAAEMGLMLSEIAGSGPDGGIMRKDVLQYAAATPHRTDRGTPGASAGAGMNSFAGNTAAAGGTAVRPGSYPAWDLPVAKRTPLKGMRKAIAVNMSRSKSMIPHFQLTASVDMTECIALRKKLKEQCGLKVSYNDILAKAIAIAIEDNPMINSSMGDGEILTFAPVNVGIAVALEQGLIVPVVREVNRKPLRQIAAESAELIQDARDGRLSPDACTMGTITISNLGMYAVDSFSAIINAPESCILAVGRIAEQPVGMNGELVLRPMMNITASIDHRVVDGAVGARFLTDLKRVLEHPLATLM